MLAPIASPGFPVTSGGAIYAFVPTGDVLVRAFGPPNVDSTNCALASPSRLAAALQFGHCEVQMYWAKNDGFIRVSAGPADHQTRYPPERYSVSVTFETPKYAEEWKHMPPG